MMARYKRLFLVGISLISCGIVFSAAASDSQRPLGIILIAIGGLFFIIDMRKKRDDDSGKEA